MAIIKLGSLIVGIRGTVGGVTFSANESGPYARIWSKGANPQTRLQQIERGFIAAQAQAWRDLTSGQRTGWDTYAAQPAQDKTNPLGESYSASGFNWFTALNQHLLQAGDPPVLNAPTPPVPTPPPINSGTVTIGPPASVILNYTAGTWLPDFKQVYFVSKRRNQTNLNPGHMQFLAIKPFPGAMATSTDLTAEVVALFGAVQEDYRYYFRASAQDPDHGRRSTNTFKTVDEA